MRHLLYCTLCNLLYKYGSFREKIIKNLAADVEVSSVVGGGGPVVLEPLADEAKGGRAGAVRGEVEHVERGRRGRSVEERREQKQGWQGERLFELGHLRGGGDRFVFLDSNLILQ